jgi:hypothetical protein
VIARHEALRRRVQLELDHIGKALPAIHRHWQKAKTGGPDQDAYINSVALNLHSFYSALERLFELIAIELDGGPLGGDSWHTELLKQMALDLEDIRPPVLGSETAARLDEYRKFRHLVRNIYTTNLDIKRIDHLLENLPGLWEQLRQELNAFLQFLGAIARADESAR